MIVAVSLILGIALAAIIVFGDRDHYWIRENRYPKHRRRR